jgi:hypothetical protein
MEKELGFPKPGDLFIGVIEFFAVLVPGVIAAFFIVKALGATFKADILFVSGLLTAGWVLGHVLDGIGSWLDPLLYDRLFKPSDLVEGSDHKSGMSRYLHKNDPLYRLANEMTDVPEESYLPSPETRVPGGMYQWARAWLNSHSAEATARLDRLEADSKLFRSLSVLFLMAILVLIANPTLPQILAETRPLEHQEPVLIITASLSVLFSLWRYCDLRNKMIRRCYLHYVQLRLERGYLPNGGAEYSRSIEEEGDLDSGIAS